MKKLTLSILALLLSLILLATVGCVEEGNQPAATDGETTTEPETTAPLNEWADLPAADALNQLMEALSAPDGDETEATDNIKMDMDMTMGITMDMDGMQNSTTLPIKLSMVQAGEDMVLKGNLVGTALDVAYVGGMLYMTIPETGERVKCVMTPEEVASAMGSLTGEEEENDSLVIPDMPELEGTKTSDLFATVTSELDETNGDLLITCKGFNTTLSGKLAPLLQPMLESLGFVGGGEWDENGELVTDPAATLAQVVGLLNQLNEETLQITFIFAKDGTLRTTEMDMTLSMDSSDVTGTYKTDFSIEGSFSIVEGGQTVRAPADSDSYTEEDWRVVFGQETAEMLGLLPDAEGCVTLSEDAAMRERQILYIYNHIEEFAGGLFSGMGYVTDSYVVDEETATNPSHIGAFEGTLTLRNPATEEEDYTTIMSFQIPESMKGEGYPANGTLINFRYAKLEIVEDSIWGSYMYLLITDYTV